MGGEDENSGTGLGQELWYGGGLCLLESSGTYDRKSHQMVVKEIIE